MADSTEQLSPQTLSFEDFWNWLLQHPGCILRVSSPAAALFDSATFHWSFLVEGDGGVHVIQLNQAKELIGEILVFSNDIAYVAAMPGEGDEVFFECIAETSDAREMVFQVVMSHAYDPGSAPSSRWTH